MSIKRHLVIGAVIISFLVGVPSVSAQVASAESLVAQINGLLLLFQDLQAELALLRAEKTVSQPILASSTSVAVLSPNGGESFMPRQSIGISWSGGDRKVQIGLVDAGYGTNSMVLGWISLNENPNGSLVWNGEKIWDITRTVNQAVSSVSSGPYKIIAVSAGVTENYCVVQHSGCNYDVSDSYFAIVSPASSNTLIISCTPAVSAGDSGAVVSWEASVLNGKSPYAYSWSGTDTISVLPPRPLSGGKTLDVIYNAPGAKTAGVTVRDATGKEASASCDSEVTIASAPSSLTLLSPNGGERFVLTKTSDPSQFVRIAWRLQQRTSRFKEEKIRVALLDAYGRECSMGSVGSRMSETFIGFVEGYRCPGASWSLSSGQYKAKVSVEGREAAAFDVSDSYFTLAKPVEDVQAVIPSASAVNSGESVKFRFVTPPNTVKASLYFSCPSGIAASPPNVCNRYNDVTSYAASRGEYAVAFSNSSSQAREVTANFYVYLPNNPNYGRGVPTRITVGATSPIPATSITILSPNGGEKIYYGVSSVYRFQSNQAGLVDLTLIPYPPIDAGLVCQIATGISASLGEVAFTIPGTGLCAKSQQKIAAGSYKLFATLRDGETKLANDLSAAPFTIAATSTVSQ